MEKDSYTTNIQSDFQKIKERLNKATQELSIKKWDLGASNSVDSSVQVDDGEA